MPTLDEVRAFLTQRSVKYDERAIPHGVSFRCAGGEVFSWYEKKGNVVIQGTPSSLANQMKSWTDSGAVPSQLPAPTAESTALLPPTSILPGLCKDVFVVYGHDDQALKDLELILRKMDLKPIILARLSGKGDTIIEKLVSFLGENSEVGFACVLLTPDDEGHKKGHPEEKKYRARQNVILELGMVLARVGRRRTAILHKRSVELPSDIAGLIYMPFEERVDEVKTDLFRHLKDVGFSPNADGLS